MREGGRRTWIVLSRWVIAPLVALGVLWIFLRDPGVTGFFATPFDAMIYGGAYKPYVYRALLPWTTRALTQVLSPDVRHEIALSVLHWPPSRAVFAILRFDTRFVVEHLISTAFMYGALLGFVVTLRRSFAALYRTEGLAADVFAIVALAAVQTMFNYVNYVYDPPTLFFSALLLFLVVKRRAVPFCAVYALSLFNKETTVLFGALFLLHTAGRAPPRRWLATAAFLIATFAVSRVILNALYAGNYGYYTILNLMTHNLALLKSYPPASVLTAGLCLAFVFGHWDRKPVVLKEALLMAPPLLGACVLWGFFDELRDYYEVYPVVALLAAPTVARLMGVKLVPGEQPARREPIVAWMRGVRGLANSRPSP